MKNLILIATLTIAQKWAIQTVEQKFHYESGGLYDICVNHSVNQEAIYLDPLIYGPSESAACFIILNEEF